MKKIIGAFCMSILFVMTYNCSPKIATADEQTTVDIPTEKPKIPDEELSPCRKFTDNVNSEELLEKYVLMHDAVKVKDWQTALELWQDVHEFAPAADGKRNTVFSDGIKIYEHYYSSEQDSTTKESHVQTIFKLYDEMDECYSKDGYVSGKKAFDLYYKFKDRASEKEIYDLFIKSFDKDGEDSYYFIINPFTALMIERLIKEEITIVESQQRVDLIKRIIAKGKNSGKNKEQWTIIDEYTSARFEDLEAFKGFYDCQYFKGKYYILYTESPNDCDVLVDVYGKLKWGGCDQNDESLQAIDKSYNANCRQAVAANVPQCRDYLKNGEYKEAIRCYEEKMNNSRDPKKQATYALFISKIYYAHLKNFPQSRKYALQAAKYKPNWGEPFVLIGKLYASSGPLCGPGRGFDSQVVTWVAIDKWNYAKRIDPSVTAEANKNINRYTQYMPSKEDIFLRQIDEGDTYTVGCWIQERTKVRVVK